MPDAVILWTRAREVLDSRGTPTVAVAIALSDGVEAEAMVPSGASTGRHEAVELRDHDPARYRGKGVRLAVANVNGEIARAIDGRRPAEVDALLIALDGTPDKSRLGANAILGASCAAARAAAMAQHVPLWRYLAVSRTPSMPVPMVNILSGGLHAGGNIEFQDFLAVPGGIPGYARQLEAIVAIHHDARERIAARGYPLTGVADEGGWGPRFSSNEEALAVLTEAIGDRGATIAIDAASTHFHSGGLYDLRTEGRSLDSAGMIDLLAQWCDRYPVTSIEDGMAEDDWDGWRALTDRLGPRCQLVGDDLFTTNLGRLERGIRDQAANAVLVKMNQIGTLAETFAVIDRAREAGFAAVISARSGETEDSFLADLAVASGAGQIKIGSITRSERLSKYNRLLAIEDELNRGTF